MPVQIGATAHNFNNPTGLLSDCHRRIEIFLGTLAAVAEKVDQPPCEETVRGLDATLRYFKQAAPKHTADEEESLFPRLRGNQRPEVKSALSALDELEKDHELVSDMHREVERLAAEYLRVGRLTDSDAGAFRELVSTLQSKYKEHIGIEDSVVFPLADRLLSETEKASIAREMAQRRNAPLAIPNANPVKPI
jgi:iron-sulfur cluster repair protein YtfE (RIC family)